MAITATFKADFSSFLQAIDKAEVALVDMSKGASKVEASLNRMVDSFSGRKLIQEATLLTIAVEKAGGVAALTAKELEHVGAKVAEAAEKMQKLGYEVPPGLQRLADATKQASDAQKEATQSGEGFGAWLGKANNLLGAFGVALSVQALINFGKAILDDASALQKLHDQSGISVERLQQLQVAGDDVGVSIGTMSKAVTDLQTRLGTGNEGASAALEELNINLADFLKLDPAQQFITIADAMRQIKDPLEFARIGSELFGKKWAELAPVIKRGFDDVKDSATGMSRETVKALADGETAIGSFWRAVKVNFGEAIADVLTLSLSKTRALRGEFAQMAEDAERHKPILAAIVPPGLPADLDAINAKFEEDARRMTESAAAAKEYSASLKAVQDIEQKIHTTIDFSIEQIGERSTAELAYVKASIAGYQQIQQIQQQNADFVAKQTLSETDYKIAKIHEWEAQTIAAFKGTAQELAAYTDAVHTRAAQQIADLSRVTAKVAETGDEYSKMYKQATEGVLVIGKGVGELAAQQQGAAKQTGDAVTAEYQRQQEAFMSFKGVVVAGTSEMIGTSEALTVAMTKPITSAGDWLSRQQQMLQAQRDRGEFFIPGMAGAGMPTRAAGGPVSAGSTYLVGEQGPELFRPSASGMIVPSGGGGTMVNNFYVNGSIKDLAQPLMNELTRLMKQTRQWPSA